VAGEGTHSNPEIKLSYHGRATLGATQGENVSDSRFDQPALPERVGGNVEIAVQLASPFLEESPGLRKKLRYALENRDAKGVNYAVYALKGSLANFGAEKTVEVAFNIEKLGKTGRLEELEGRKVNL
jgi:HPt (histidine-containing phosphotransfer) domain-containing protein